MAKQSYDYNKNYYRTLGLSEDASDTEIKKAYRRQNSKYHPDKGQTAIDNVKAKFNQKAGESETNYNARILKQQSSIMHQIQDAYAVLSKEREAYDAFQQKHKKSQSKQQTNDFNQKSGSSTTPEQSKAKQRKTVEQPINSPKDGSTGTYKGEAINNTPNGNGKFYNASGHLEFEGTWADGRIIHGTEYTGDKQMLFIFEGNFLYKDQKRTYGFGRRFFYSPAYDYEAGKYEFSYPTDAKPSDFQHVCEADFSKTPVIGAFYDAYKKTENEEYLLHLLYEGPIGVTTYSKDGKEAKRLGYDDIPSPIGLLYCYDYGRHYQPHPEKKVQHFPGRRPSMNYLCQEGEIKTVDWNLQMGARFEGQGKRYHHNENLLFEGIFAKEHDTHADGAPKINDIFEGKGFCPFTGTCIFEGKQVDWSSQSGSAIGKHYDRDTGKLYYDGEASYAHYSNGNAPTTYYNDRPQDYFFSQKNGEHSYMIKRGIGKEYNPRTGELIHNGEFEADRPKKYLFGFIPL